MLVELYYFIYLRAGENATLAYNERKLLAGERRVPYLIAYFDLLLIHGPYL